MPKLSILQLDTHFPRLPGDVGCAATFAAPVDICPIPATSVAGIVTRHPDGSDIAGFVECLGESRADLIATSCGFLCYWQEHLAAVAKAPFISSALIDLPRLQQCYPHDQLMIITFDAEVLSAPLYADVLGGFGGTIVGLPRHCQLRQVIEGDRPTLDPRQAEDELLALISEAIGNAGAKPQAILLECTNLGPYKNAIRNTFNSEIHDILSVINRAMPAVVDAQFL